MCIKCSINQSVVILVSIYFLWSVGDVVVSGGINER